MEMYISKSFAKCSPDSIRTKRPLQANRGVVEVKNNITT